jgi:HTH-type transcriptional regulator, quorum sensing regulator NprR
MIGQRIKELRKNAKLTQQELAEGIITRSYLSQIEKGMVQPSYEVLERIADKLGCSVEAFYETVENKDLFILQLKKEIKTAENQVESNRFEKLKSLIQKEEYLQHPELNEYDKGILNWLHGRYNESMGDFTKAEIFYKTSISYLENTAYFSELVRSFDSLGNTYIQMDENERALQVLNQGYRMMIYEHVGGIHKVSLLTNLGVAHGKLNEYYSAINFLLEAQELNQRMDMHYKAGQLYMALGVCYMQLKRFTEAQQAYEQALKVFKLTNDREREAGIYTNLGILSAHCKEYAKSIEQLKAAVDLYKEIEANEARLQNAKAELAKSLFAIGRIEEAAKLCYDIIDSKQIDKTQGYAYELLGDIDFKRDHTDKALNNYELASNVYRKLKLNKKLKEINQKIADFYFKSGNHLRAIEYYRLCMMEPS